MRKYIFLLVSLLLSTNLFIYPADDGVPESKSFAPPSKQEDIQPVCVHPMLLSLAHIFGKEITKMPKLNSLAVDQNESEWLYYEDEEPQPEPTERAKKPNTLQGLYAGPLGEVLSFLPEKDLISSQNTCRWLKTCGDNLRQHLYHNLPPEEKNQRLINAVKAGCLKIVKLLIRKGANIDIHNQYGYTALIKASRNGPKEIIELLLEKDANIDIQNKFGYTTLIKASRNGHKEIVELLLEKGANIDIQDQYGETALIEASRSGHKEIVELLLSKCANIEIQNNFGSTALMWASRTGQRKIVELLIEKGANIDIQHTSGDTALMWAERYGLREIAQILRQVIARKQQHQQPRRSCVIQ
mgnify:CR=1 FL=1